MTALAKILEDRGLNANRLAGMLNGVAAPNVYKWKNGEQPIPSYRADEIAKVLDLTAGERLLLDDQISEDGRAAVLQKGAEPTTYLAYAFLNSFIDPGSGETYSDSLKRFAKAVGLPPITVAQYIAGERFIPLSEVEQIAEALAPARPEWVIGGLAHEVQGPTFDSEAFDRLRTDLSNADDRATITEILAAYDETSTIIGTMRPVLVLAALGVQSKDTHETANEIGRRFAADRRNS